MLNTTKSAKELLTYIDENFLCLTEAEAESVHRSIVSKKTYGEFVQVLIDYHGISEPTTKELNKFKSLFNKAKKELDKD